MSMDQDKIKSLALELAKDVKALEDLSELSAQLTKITVEAALGAEVEAHHSYAPNQFTGRKQKNNRNGYSQKTL